MIPRPATREALDRLQKGAVAFARVEAAGLRVDVPYLDSAIKKLDAEIADAKKRMESDKVYKVWHREFGLDINFNSYTQLGRVVFDVLGFRRNPFLGNSNKEVAFKQVARESQFVKDYFSVQRLSKAVNTFLRGIRREVVDGFVHPFQQLHTAESYRSSSRSPNLHNQPARNREIAKTVRTSIVPRKGRKLITTDFSSHEVRISCCHHKDPMYTKYVLGGGDMHKDLALRLYLLTDQELGDTDSGSGKDIRYVAKNKFTFAQNYGSFYCLCAPELWEAIEDYDLKTTDGKSLYQHLAAKGIDHLGPCDPEIEPEKGSFEHHVRQVERWYWDEQFRVYGQWRKDWYAEYQRHGAFNSLCGYRFEGFFRRNQVLCDPIQCDAFHCELWALIHIQNELIRRKMRTVIVNQIHDSIMADVPPEEEEEYCEIAKRVSMEELPRAWKWITVPLHVDFESTSTNWSESKKVKKEMVA